jgi:hypothetical protein
MEALLSLRLEFLALYAITLTSDISGPCSLKRLKVGEIPDYKTLALLPLEETEFSFEISSTFYQSGDFYWWDPAHRFDDDNLDDDNLDPMQYFRALTFLMNSDSEKIVMTNFPDLDIALLAEFMCQVLPLSTTIGIKSRLFFRKLSWPDTHNYYCQKTRSMCIEAGKTLIDLLGPGTGNPIIYLQNLGSLVATPQYSGLKEEEEEEYELGYYALSDCDHLDEHDKKEITKRDDEFYSTSFSLNSN